MDLHNSLKWLGCLLAGLLFAAAPARAENEPQNFTGTYAGVYTYGEGFGANTGSRVKFRLKLKQEPGDQSFTGTIEEDYTGFGTPKDGKLWALIQGEFSTNKGKVKLRFVKTYRYFDQPSVNYTGTYDAERKSFDGTWVFSSTPSRGTFTLQRLATP